MENLTEEHSLTLFDQQYSPKSYIFKFYFMQIQLLARFPRKVFNRQQIFAIIR